MFRSRDALTRQMKKVATCSCCKKPIEKSREPIYKKKSQSYQRRLVTLRPLIVE